MALTSISVFTGTSTTRRLDPVSQEGNGIYNDCGPACMLNLLWDCGLAVGELLTKWAPLTDPTHNGTTPADLGNMARKLGGVPEYGLVAQYPYIELVEYNRLPFINPNYKGRTFKHWIVRESDTTYFDPLWPVAQAGRKTTTKAVLDAAEVSIPARVGLSNPRILDMPIHDNKTFTWEITAENYRVRADADSKAVTLGALVKGQKGTALGTAVVGADKWAAVRLGAGGSDLAELNETTLTTGGVKVAWMKYGSGWKIVAPVVTPPVTPPPVPASGFKLGVSVLNSHNLLEPAYAAGIRAFLIMDGVLAAVQFKRAHPDAVVMYRRFLPHGAGIPDPAAFAAEAGMGNGVVFVSPLNECDNWCYGSPAEIESRAKFDAALAAMCKASGTVYAGGGFSMGTPDFTRADICDAMKRFYAPHYNSGLMGINMHLYSPNMQHIYTAANWIWYERRWQFLFDKCGFDPSPNLVGIYSDETGVDEGGVGGFPAHGAGGAAVQQWGREFCKAQRQPLSAAFPSPVRAATIFQAGDTGKWSGYNVSPWLGDIAKANQ